MKKALVTASLLLVAAATAACGGSDAPKDAPEEASRGDFCTQMVEANSLDDGKAIHSWADEMLKIGTPKDLSGEERDGFEVLMEAADSIKDDAKASELGEEGDFSDAEQKKVQAFATYFTTTCGPEIQKATKDLLPSDAPTVD